MNPITPWLDPGELRRLAENLVNRPAPPLECDASDAGFGSGFVGFATEVAPPEPARESAAIEQVPVPSLPAPSPPAAAPGEPVAASRGPFLERISRFRDWLAYHFRASGVFILDREGFVIFDESGHGKLHFLARSLAMTSRRPGNPSTNVHVKIGAGATLEVVPVETPYGWLVLGMVVPEPMSPAAVAVITESLTRVAAPPGEVG